MKRFILKTILYLLLALLPVIVPLIIYSCHVKPNISGDLDALSVTLFPKDYAKIDSAALFNATECDYSTVPSDSSILVIGDSFAKLSSNTLTSFASYIEETSGLHTYVLAPDWTHNHVYRLLYLLRTQKPPRYLVVECAERYMNNKFGNFRPDFTLSDLESEVTAWRKMEDEQANSEAEWILTPDFSEIINSQDMVRKKVFKKETAVETLLLTDPMFSLDGERARQLLFYEEDLWFTKEELKYDIINKTLLLMDSLAASNNCTMFFVPTVDKYDAYSPYIVDNQHPQNHTIDSLECRLDKRINFINVKDTISAMLRNHVKDVYWSNNTHWSPIGSKAVGNAIGLKIKHSCTKSAK